MNPSEQHSLLTIALLAAFADGRAGYDIQYLTRDELSADVLRQYERYLVLSQDQGQDLLSGAPEHTPPETGA